MREKEKEVDIMKNLKRCTLKELVKMVGENALKLSKVSNKTDEVKVVLARYKALYDLSQEDPKAIKKADVLCLAEAMQEVMADEFIDKVEVVAKVENSQKKSLKKTTTPKEETPVAEEAKEDAVASSVVAREEVEEEETEETEEAVEEVVDEEAVFVPEVEFNGEKYALVNSINTMSTLYKAMEENSEDYLIAHFWSASMLKEYGYFDELLEYPESFPNNLDLTSLVYISDAKKVAYTVSCYTEAFYTILPNDFKTKTSNGVEFEIYKKVK